MKTCGIWTGSLPCQPFSVSGKRLAQEDERHLAPTWLNLVCECHPDPIFGEQVALAIGHGWLDDLFVSLEHEGYACGAAVLPASGIGVPHIRRRLFFGAVRLAHADFAGLQGWGGVSEYTDEVASWVRGLASRPAGLYHGFWANLDWTGCRDGRFRPVEPCTHLLANGISARVVRLCGYGNAIVSQLAAAFIMSFIEAVGEVT